jgi:hypothetical protein
MQIQVKSRQDRKSFVSNSPVQRDHREEFDGSMLTLPIKKIPIEYLVYRLNNMRTTVEQLEYISQNDLEQDYFKSHQESDTAQLAQHQILVEMSKSAIANIWDALKQRRSLRDPLVITPDCVVVNGNRRLAAMRDLIHESPLDFDNFRTVECIVLPESDESTLVDYETRIQIARDLRSEYGWVHTALGLQTQISVLNWSQERAVQAWGMEWKDLAGLLQSFSFATEYLEFIEKSGNFAELKDKEQVFKTLAETQAKEKRDGTDAVTLHAQRLFVYNVLRTGDFEGRAFDYARMSPDLLKRAKESLKTDLQPDVGTPATTSTDPNDPFADSPDATNESEAAQILNVLKNKGNADAVRDLAEAAKNQIALERNAQKRRAVLVSNSRSAFNQLNSVSSIEETDSNSISTALPILLDIIREVERLIGLITARHPNAMAEIDKGRVAATELRIDDLVQHLKTD